MNIRVGFGYDVHRLIEGRELWLGGIRLEHSSGLLGHSDADVLIHAICDALLGAAALGDIGTHFPDSSPRYHNADSLVLLQEVVRMLRSENLHPINVDSVIIAQAPKMAPYIAEMQRKIALAMGVEPDLVSVKATTTEKLGYLGKGEGIAAQAVVLLENR